MSELEKYRNKKKWVSITLALFFGMWTYLYTYKVDSTKFWIMLITNFLFWWTIIVPIVISLWALIQVVARPKVFYEKYDQI